MPFRTIRLFCTFAFLLCIGSFTTAFAQTSAFTYQGQLQSGGAPANGVFDFQFLLFDAASSGSAVGEATSIEDVAVTNGLFSALLDPGAAALDGAQRWLEIRVRAGSSTDAFTVLSPRQLLRPTPYAFRAANFSGAVALGQLPLAVARLDSSNQVFTGAVQFSNPPNTFTGIFTGNAAGLTNLKTGTNPTPDVGQLLAFPNWLNYSNHYPMTILSIGDSIAADADFTSLLVAKLAKRFSLNGWWAESYLGHEAWPTNEGNAVTLSGDTNWIGNYHALFSIGDAVAYGGTDQTNGPLSNHLEVYWIQHPGGGEFDVKVMSGGSGNWTDVVRLTGYASTRRGAYTNLNVPFNYTKPRVVNASASTNYIITAAPYLDSLQGVRYACISHPGLDFRDFTNVDAAIRDVILTNMKPAMVILNNRETPTPAQAYCIQEVNRWLKLAQSSADVIYVGGYWWGSDSEATIQEDIFFYTNAVANGFQYFDSRTPFISWDYMLQHNLVISPLSPHLTYTGRLWWLSIFEQRFGLANYYASSPKEPLASLNVYAQGNESPLVINGGNTCGSWSTFLGGWCSISALWFCGGDGDGSKLALAGNQNATILNSPTSAGGPQFAQGYYNQVGSFLPNGKFRANYGFVGDASALTNLVTMTANSSGAASFNNQGYSETIFNSNPAVLPSLTLALPNSSSPGQIVRYLTAGGASSVTVSGTVLIGESLTTLPANGVVAWQSANSSGQWLRIR